MSQNIAIETAYNVALTFRAATIWDRTWAFLLDAIIKVSYIFLMLSLLTPLLDIGGAGYFLTIFILPYVFYSFIFELILDGQTPGKLALNIKVVSLNGKRLSISQVFIRWIFRFLDFFLFGSGLAFLSILVTEKGQRLGDLVAETTVISTKRPSILKRTSYVRLKPDYQAIYPESQLLNDTQIELLKTIIKDQSKVSLELKTSMASKLEDVLGIQKKDSSANFLKTLVRDYNYYIQLEEKNNAVSGKDKSYTSSIKNPDDTQSDTTKTEKEMDLVQENLS